MKKIIVSACVALFLMIPMVNSTAANVDDGDHCFGDYWWAYNGAIAAGFNSQVAEMAGWAAFDACGADLYNK